MAKIPDKQLERLRSAGLFVSEPAPPTHVMPGFVLVNKPKSVPGNIIPDYSTQYDIDGDIEFDAPFVTLHFNQEDWVVEAVDHAPALGPGDFINTWKTAEEAIDDIIEFFLGDPKRMNEKAKKKAEVRARIKSYKKETE